MTTPPPFLLRNAAQALRKHSYLLQPESDDWREVRQLANELAVWAVQIETSHPTLSGGRDDD